MALPGIKFDEGSGGFASNCFPVRGLLHQGDEVGGAWLVAQKAEQRRRFKAILCTKPRTYSRIREERKKAERQGTQLTFEEDDNFEGKEKEDLILDGFYLMKHCCVEDPSHLCSINIAGEELSDVKEEDFTLFDNVAYVNAGENYLPFEAFRGFPIIRELEMPLNGLRSLKIGMNDFPSLEMLDLSYNNLSEVDILNLGILPNLRVLHLTGNNFKNIPAEMALPFLDVESKSFHPRYEKLEILMLDENKLSDYNVFAALAGLQRLRQLSLEKNQIYFVPQLKSREGKLVIQEEKPVQRKSGRSSRKSSRTPRSARSSRKSAVEVKDSKEIETTTIVEAEEPTDQPVDSISEHDIDIKDKPAAQDENAVIEEDLTKEDLNTNVEDLSAKISELNMEAEIQGKATTTATEPSLPPFPELRLLNLAHNQVENEEALLAVAAWPMLVELIIHDNPLTTEKSGDPPLLKKFLHDRLGVNLIRKRETKNKKPGYEVPPRESRFVSTVVPKIPKVGVEEILMLEAPKPPPPKQTTDISDRKVSPARAASRPLPPIKQVSDIQEIHEEPDMDSLPTNAWTENDANMNADDNQEGDAFFMTQVDDQEDEKPRHQHKAEKHHPRKKKVKKPTKEQNDERYKGFELLLDYDDESDSEDPKDIQGNIRALKYALNHRRVYRDAAVNLDRVKKPVPPYRKPEPVTGKPVRTKDDRMEDLLTNLKERSTHEEANLNDVINNKPKLQKQFPEAKKLLCEIQRRYNTVRVNSMKDAKDAKKSLQTTKIQEKKHTTAPIVGTS